jgi:hypothetical protein
MRSLVPMLHQICTPKFVTLGGENDKKLSLVASPFLSEIEKRLSLHTIK